MDSKRAPSKPQLELELTCQDRGVAFLSCHETMYNLRDEGIYCQGFHNTIPGAGHLNETGHRVVAEAVLQLLDIPTDSGRE
jgi:hypothetical protein